MGSVELFSCLQSRLYRSSSRVMEISVDLDGFDGGSDRIRCIKWNFRVHQPQYAKNVLNLWIEYLKA